MTFKPPFLTLPELSAPPQIRARIKTAKGIMYAISESRRDNALTLGGSLPLLKPIPPRGNINTETILQRDRTDQIRRGGV